MFPRAAPSLLLENLLQMQIILYNPKDTQWKIWKNNKLYFNKPFRCCDHDKLWDPMT